MLANVLSDSSAIFAIILAVSTAILGAIIAAVKIPTDRGTAAMAQAQGANEALSEALEAIERERDYWENRFRICHKEKSDLYAELMRIRNEGRD